MCVLLILNIFIVTQYSSTYLILYVSGFSQREKENFIAKCFSRKFTTNIFHQSNIVMHLSVSLYCKHISPFQCSSNATNLHDLSSAQRGSHLRSQGAGNQGKGSVTPSHIYKRGIEKALTY